MCKSVLGLCNHTDWLYKLEQTEEARHGEHLADVVADVPHADVYALGLGILQHSKEQAQAAGRNVFEFGAVENDVAPTGVLQGQQVLFGLFGGDCVETPVEKRHQSSVLLVNGCLHHGLVIVGWYGWFQHAKVSKN